MYLSLIHIINQGNHILEFCLYLCYLCQGFGLTFFQFLLFLVVLTFSLAWRYVLSIGCLPRWFLPYFYFPCLYLLYQLKSIDSTHLPLTVLVPSTAVSFLVDCEDVTCVAMPYCTLPISMKNIWGVNQSREKSLLNLNSFILCSVDPLRQQKRGMLSLCLQHLKNFPLSLHIIGRQGHSFKVIVIGRGCST